MGKEQEVHKSDGLILKPYLTLFALSGLIIGFITLSQTGILGGNVKILKTDHIIILPYIREACTADRCRASAEKTGKTLQKNRCCL